MTKGELKAQEYRTRAEDALASAEATSLARVQEQRRRAAAVWTGATLALTTTSLLGIYAGRRFLNRLPLLWIHRISGVFFLLLAAFAGYRLIQG